MKIDIDDIVRLCQRYDSQAQKKLYDHFKGLLFGICRRYLNSDEDAKDMMAEAFVKIFNNIHEFKFNGSFEGWIRRITVNECLMHLRKKKIHFEELDHHQIEMAEQGEYPFEVNPHSLLSLMDKLPEGYRAVLNLYVIEELKHREIADLLGISINTSKSQLILAKRKLLQMALQLNIKPHFT